MYDVVVQRIDPEGLAGANLVRSSFRNADEDKIYAKLHHPATEKRLVSLGFGASVNREGGRTSADRALMTMKEFYGNKVGEELLTHAAPTFVDPGLVPA